MLPSDPIDAIFRLSESQRRALLKLGIETAGNLLYHFPSRYGDVAEARTIGELRRGETAAVFGTISKLEATKAFRKQIPMATALLSDDSGKKIKLVWFNQPYLAKMLPDGALVRVEGKVSERGAGAHAQQRGRASELYFSNPKIERVGEIPTGGASSLFGETTDSHSLHPVYPESRGITSNWLFHAIQKLLKTAAPHALTDPIPKDILKKYHLPRLSAALVWIHAPKHPDHALAARKRFAFEEVFVIQLQKQRERMLWQREKSFAIERGEDRVRPFVARFPFQFTGAQTRALAAVLADFKKGMPMARLLEGDVGSGKTAVAAATAYAVVTSRPQGQSFGRLQVAYMCPTEILARQQFEDFISFFSHLPVTIGLMTSSGCRKFPSKVDPHGATGTSRAQLLKWVANGEIPILVGTHSLIQKAVRFKHLAYVIIDEQHRFGVNQRKALVRRTNAEQTQNDTEKQKSVLDNPAPAPHLLSMTATPIPRTLALTMYGDLELTVLDELPPGRKPILTEIVSPHEREAVYAKIREELKSGRQAYVITPRIEEPDPAKAAAVQARSAKKEAERLAREVFPEFEIGVMHGKLKDSEKEAAMERFKDGSVRVLVSTSVVEVGMNVPNATVIAIEGAERFGLAQLHQLRGRVQRSSHQAHCYVFAETAGAKAMERLRALKAAHNGFVLAEYDLQSRGAGELAGSQQWGVSDVAMEALQNLKMVEAARTEARGLLEKDLNLAKYPLLQSHLASRRKKEIHFE